MNVIIVEDEEVAFKNLSKMLTKSDPAIEVVKNLKSVRNSIEWFQSNPLPDLIFLDIRLVDGLSFEIFQTVEINVPIIFTTAYDEYAVKAFELNSIDYLLKPFSQESLDNSIAKLLKLNRDNSFTQVDKIKQIFFDMSERSKKYKKRFLVKIGDKLIPKLTNDIAYFQRDELVMLVDDNNSRFAVNYSLDELERLLDPQQFFRLNRQFLVNINSIEAANSYFAGKLKIILKPKPEMDVVISQEKSSQFKSWLSGD